MEAYVKIADCWECLEDYLLFSDFGFSDLSARTLAALKHISDPRRLPSNVKTYLSELGPKHEA